MAIAPLKNELVNDPAGLGYAGMSDAEAADALNDKTIDRPLLVVSGRDVKGQVIITEYTALAPEKKAQFLSLVARDDLDPFGADASFVVDIFGSGSQTVGNLASIRNEQISRAEQVGGIAVPVKPGHVEAARAV